MPGVQAGSSASPICPDSANVGSVTTISSLHTYQVINDSDEDVYVDVVAELIDDRGNHNRATRSNLLVSAHSTEEEDLNPMLNVPYDAPGTVLVTATTTVTGAAESQTEAQCTFEVEAAN